MKGWLSINQLLDPKSFTRSGVHNSSCGEVLEIVPSNELQQCTSAIWPSTACNISVITQVLIVQFTSSDLLPVR